MRALPRLPFLPWRALVFFVAFWFCQPAFCEGGGGFRDAVLPVLLLHCSECHGRQVHEGGLDVRRVEFLLKGGKSGAAIVPGNPSESLLIRKIRDGAMPPREKLASHSVKPVEAEELERMERWIASGAKADDEMEAAVIPSVRASDREHWAFQPPRSGPVPWTGSGESGNGIDGFIHQELREQGLGFSSEAARHSLVRRVYFDLLGVPPEPEAVERFVRDPDPQAYEKLVDRLLASPAYGERWGQYWLDLSGYADSEGVQHADPERPFAYRYRDYVIRAFNSDKPYDRFLLEQIAGDELADYENGREITPEIYDNLVATGFLRMSSDGTFAGITGFVPNRLDVIDDQIRVLSSSVMGLSMRCARCHSHKFDPIPQQDYYRLAAVFKGAMDEYDWLRPIKSAVGGPRYLPYVTAGERSAWEQADAALKRDLEPLRGKLDDLKKADATAESKEAIGKVEAQIKQIEARRTPEPMIRALWDRGDPSPTYLLRRGDYRYPTEIVQPGVPAVLDPDGAGFGPVPPWPGSTKTGNRLAFARWLVRPEHPLTARVMVNRIWKHHFGQGLVEPLDDFGRAGGRPSHPELLDWLAKEFVRRGWSFKQMHRLMMHSRTYRQASDLTDELIRKDPGNRWLARMPLRRMEAEVLRDSLLALAGRLREEPFGRADGVEARADGLVSAKERNAGWRRSIYVQKRRTQRLTLLDDFDRPRMSPNCVDRPVSNVAPQALHLLNNEWIHTLSLALADRILGGAGDSDEDRIDVLYRLVLSRSPSPEERAVAVEALREIRMAWAESGSAEAGRRSLANVSHALMNSAAFLYID
ncbi:MAG: PSD1 and planctomycete cytochrome C domain-containing protein [Verrucomicrobia bacterium]|nr:PSD1 and planctomycete cytochrome C domain-containing protein [Verrucomicrobiota bacterium]